MIVLFWAVAVNVLCSAALLWLTHNEKAYWKREADRLGNRADSLKRQHAEERVDANKEASRILSEANQKHGQEVLRLRKQHEAEILRLREGGEKVLGRLMEANIRRPMQEGVYSIEVCLDRQMVEYLHTEQQKEYMAEHAAHIVRSKILSSVFVRRGS